MPRSVTVWSPETVFGNATLAVRNTMGSRVGRYKRTGRGNNWRAAAQALDAWFVLCVSVGRPEVCSIVLNSTYARITRKANAGQILNQRDAERIRAILSRQHRTGNDGINGLGAGRQRDSEM